MENPCLTFVTPTLLAGDRSLADVVAHEISHSWTGNVITNCTWEHFWLNEGWTVWLERKIKKEFVRRKESSTSAAEEAYAVAAQVGLAHLTGSVEHFERLKQPEYTRLVPILEGDIDPDDVFSAVPYEKGYNLLNTLEQTVGEEKFLKILVKNYIAKFKFKTITSAEFKTFCMEECFPSGELKSIDWDMWFFAYGMPKMPFSFTSASIAEATTLADSWASNEEEKTEVLEKLATDTHAKWSGWITETRLVFFERLNKQMSTKTSSSWSSEKLALFSTKALAGLLTTQNCELLFQWFQLLLKTPHWKDYEGEITKMLTSQGRMKYTRPLYRSLASADYGVAKKLFEGNRDFYHPICRNIVVKDIASFAPTTTTGTT
ncbi:unnamed protein product [Amoebophrya sp. A25]|nr:unnamed protein product [Amoebophrya sp. A25]|eukprot:GSA25T00006611001.1